MGGVTTFDRLFAEAAPLVDQRLHQRDTPPVDGGRWPLSVLLRPGKTSAEKLEQTMAEAELSAGSGHFRTGIAGSVHFTVRALEPYREAVGDGDEAAVRYARAMSRAAGAVGTIELDLVGLTLTPGSVIVCARPVDDTPTGSRTCSRTSSVRTRGSRPVSDGTSGTPRFSISPPTSNSRPSWLSGWTSGASSTWDGR